MTRRLLLVLGLAVVSAGAPAASLCAAKRAGEQAGGAGVLVLAHGGSAAWNQTVQETVAQARLPLPVEVAFGMGFHEHEAQALQAAVDRLEARGAQQLIVVPLLVSSHSEVFRQLEYLLGARQESPIPGSPVPIARRVPVRFTAPLEGGACVAEVLWERSRALSRDPRRETVILVAHGPNTARDNRAWMAVLRRWSLDVQGRGGFRKVEAATLRDDAEPTVEARATRALRRQVARAARQGPVLIVPVLVARGGIEQTIPDRLEGLTYTFSGETLLPHPRISAWIAETVRHRMGKPSNI